MVSYFRCCNSRQLPNTYCVSKTHISSRLTNNAQPILCTIVAALFGEVACSKRGVDLKIEHRASRNAQPDSAAIQKAVSQYISPHAICRSPELLRERGAQVFATKRGRGATALEPIAETVARSRAGAACSLASLAGAQRLAAVWWQSGSDGALQDYKAACDSTVSDVIHSEAGGRSALRDLSIPTKVKELRKASSPRRLLCLTSEAKSMSC